MNVVIIVVYLASMLLFGWWGRRRTQGSSDYLLAGRRLGPLLYVGTMSAVVLGGASTVGGVGLDYAYGISGMWLVAAIGVGVLLLSLLFAPVLQHLKIYTVSQMLTLRYGSEATQVSAVVMLAYTLMLAATSTVAYASIFVVLFGWERWLAIVVGGAIVLAYSVIGGMGLQSIITYFVIYTLGLLIGQDIWQRVFTARSPEVARWGGTAAGVYVILYGVAGALIGMAAAVVLPGIEVRDDVFASVALEMLPVGLGGLALAAAVAAMMSTASGALIAAATVARADVVPLARKILSGRRPATLDAQAARTEAEHEAAGAQRFEEDVTANRWWVLGLGLFVLALAVLVPDVVAALTIAYAILVGGLMVAIIGGLVWSRGTGAGAAWSMLAGTVGTLATMITIEVQGEEPFTGVYANEPIYVGLAASAVVYVVLSLLTRPIHPSVLEAWHRRRVEGGEEFVPGASLTPTRSH